MNEDMEVLQKQMAEARANKERETFRDMVALTALGALLSGGETYTNKDELCLEAYSYAYAMLRVKEG